MCSASVELCALCGLRKRGIVYFVLSPRAWNCNVLRKSGIVLRKRGIVCFVLSPRAWNCNVLRKRRIVCFMWSPQALNCVLYIVSTSMES